MMTLSAAGVPWSVVETLSDRMRTAMYIVAVEMKGEAKFNFNSWTWQAREQ
jgi:hypothetical protein